VLNNIRVAHIEGGEVTGTADEFMRHANSKLSSYHFVANNESLYRLIQMGENEESIYIIGSPDIDIMVMKNLPLLNTVLTKYNIPFKKFAIFIYHPVTTSYNIRADMEQIVSALEESDLNYIVINPNNDHGADIVREMLEPLKNNPQFMFFNSVIFEDFLTLLKNSDFIIGNSSAGVREACVYGVPAIDIGSRQNKRYIPKALRNIQHTNEVRNDILDAIQKVDKHRHISFYWGNGNSAEEFQKAMKTLVITKKDLQKSFVEMEATNEAIMNYINEVCF